MHNPEKNLPVPDITKIFLKSTSFKSGGKKKKIYNKNSKTDD